MKNLHLIICLWLALSVLHLSCKEEQPPVYAFIDQKLTGKIGTSNWAYQDGFAEVVSSGDENNLRVELFLEQQEKGCGVFIPEGNSMFFYIPGKKGVYPLHFDMQGSNSLIVTLYEEDDPIGVNHHAGEGAVEIVSITETEVQGRVDAWADGENYVNGNFVIAICD